MTSTEKVSDTASRPPTLEELMDCDNRARGRIGHPELYAWKSPDKPNYLLTVTYGVGSLPPTWILHAGEGEDAAVVWIAMTTVIDEILVKVNRAVHETNSVAVVKAIKSRAEQQELIDEQPSAVLKRGTIFADRYEIISQLGHGGMGIVYKAKQVGNGEIIGLKVLHPHLVTDNLSRARFEQEAQKSNLTHRNLINIRKFGFSASGQPFIAMDFLDGCPLTELIEKGPLNLESFTNIFTQVAEGLYHAHSKGVIHRDIKPGNIMVCNGNTGSPTIKIVDFGIAKSNIVAGKDSRLTPTGEVLGSPLYMSPEQCAGGAPDPRSDIYSLGCVMYETLMGVPPFNHTNPIKLILMQISERPPSFREACQSESFPYEQERIVMKALEKDPSRRYQTAEELGRDLWQLIVTGSSGPVRSISGDLRKAPKLLEAKILPLAESSASPLAESSDIRDVIKSAGKTKKLLTFRFRKFKSLPDKEQIAQSLEMALRLIKKGADLSIYLDYEAAHLIHKMEYMAPEFHSDFSSTERIQNIQTGFNKIIKAGGSVITSEHWLRFFGILSGGKDAQIPDITILDDDELAEFLMERGPSFIDYT